MKVRNVQRAQGRLDSNLRQGIKQLWARKLLGSVDFPRRIFSQAVEIKV